VTVLSNSSFLVYIVKESRGQQQQKKGREMPSPSDFRKSFGFEATEHGTFHGIEYEDAQFKHIVKQRNERYEFPAKITFASGTTKKTVENALKKYIPKETIVLSAYGNPYKCKMGNFKVEARSDGKVVAKAVGVALRDRSNPKARKRKRGNNDAKEVLEQQGWKVQNSHFATGKCAGCHETIGVGEPIAKKSKRERSGWFHAECAKQI
jgi:hypothetical protein